VSVLGANHSPKPDAALKTTQSTTRIGAVDPRIQLGKQCKEKDGARFGKMVKRAHWGGGVRHNAGIRIFCVEQFQDRYKETKSEL